MIPAELEAALRPVIEVLEVEVIEAQIEAQDDHLRCLLGEYLAYYHEDRTRSAMSSGCHSRRTRIGEAQASGAPSGVRQTTYGCMTGRVT